MPYNDTVKVWDPLVRVFHWSLALAFTVAYASSDDWQDLHIITGYLIGGLVLFRLLWGVIGPAHARFGDFVRGPRAVLAYLKQLRGGHPTRYLGHNPAGGAMIVLLLFSLGVAVLTGLGLYAAEDGAGPLAGLIPTAHRWADILEDLHEFSANFTLLLVLGHVAGVVLSSLLHKENLVRAMITGRKPKETP